MADEIKLNAVLDNTPGSLILEHGLCRVIGFEKGDAWVIDLVRPHRAKSNRTSTYRRGPYRRDLETSKSWLRANKIFVHNPGRGFRDLTDKDRLAQAKTSRERRRVETSIKRRDKRWKILLPLISHTDRKTKEVTYHSAADLLADPTLGDKVRTCAKKSGVSIITAYTLLHEYWAGGSCKNALYTHHDLSGGKGQTRAQGDESYGRQSRLFKAKQTPFLAYKLDKGKGRDSHKDPASEKVKLAWGWRLIKHGVTAKDAYLLVSAVHWADHVVENGRTVSKLWEKHLRPSFNQFTYWGHKLNGGKRVADALFGKAKTEQKNESRGGSEQDMVTRVGQLAVFDGTKTDVYLTTRKSRLKKLPPMLRLVIKDVRTGVYCGWYLGWDPASPATAIQAIYHAATSKVDEFRRYGIELKEGVVPAILHRAFLADNGELKAEAVTEFEGQFQVSIRYTQAGRGDKKGGVETQHHKDHKLLDHKLPGTSRGKQRERGEDHAALYALHNAYEYRREFLLHVIDNNNEEVPELWPMRMRLSLPDVAPTRANIFNWLREQEGSSEVPFNEEHLRAFALPDVEAVIRKNGVYPLYKVLGTRVILPGTRMSSPELVATGLLSEVKRTGKTIPVRLKASDSMPDRAWLPTKDGMIPLRWAGRPERVLNTLSSADYIGLHEEWLLRKDARAQEYEQKDLDRIQRRGTVVQNAEAELKSELAALDRKPSKAGTVANLDANLAEEMADERKDQETVLVAKFAPGEGAEEARVSAAPTSLKKPSKTADQGESQNAGSASTTTHDPAGAAMAALNDDEEY